MQKIYRLTNNASFNYLYHKGERYSSNLVTIYYVKATSIKVGISVSKKVGKSVVRSLIKRRLNENFRKLIPFLTVKANYVVVAKPEIVSVDFNTIGNDLVRILTKLGHLPEDSKL